MTDTTTLIQRLRGASQGHDEWRAQNPEDACYCISFSRINSLDPECEARSWLADHIKQFPNGRFVDYVVACVRVTSEADQLRLAAADALEQQAAQIDALRADAERYRWLRNQKESLYYLIPGAREAMGFVDLAAMPQFDDLDAAIDAALRQEQPT